MGKNLTWLTQRLWDLQMDGNKSLCGEKFKGEGGNMAVFELILCTIAAVVVSSFVSRFVPKVSTPLVQIVAVEPKDSAVLQGGEFH